MIRNSLYLILAAAIALCLEVGAGVSSVPQTEAFAVVTRFCREVEIHGGFSYWEFEGTNRQRMKPLLSKRLLARLDNTHACFRDWARHQPLNSTDKPPGVDCCIFSASADWLPDSFAIQESRRLPDGRQRVTVEYGRDSPREPETSHIAVYVTNEGGRYVVDDFEGGFDDPQSDRWFVADDDPNCKEGKWVGTH
jgi:hypothetical protein